jgi:hypothetical protein
VSTSSNFLERNNVWQENKLEKIVRDKEDEVTKGLEECTFKPKLNTNYRNASARHRLLPSKSTDGIKNKPEREEGLPGGLPGKGRPNMVELTKEQVGNLRTLIRNELRRI